MEAEFWLQRWQEGKIGFHLGEVNPVLVKHFTALALNKGQRIFVPLCGKTLDIEWLLSEGYQVVGVELCEGAIKQLFSGLDIHPEIISNKGMSCYQAENITLFVGDMFQLEKEQVGHIDAIYDRAALIALPETMRRKYVAQLMQLAHFAKQLLITLEYDQDMVAGPPFSVSVKELKQYYSQFYHISLLECIATVDGLKGKYPVQENIWLLK